MKFVDSFISFLGSCFSFIGEMIWKLIEFISKPFTYLYYFLDGVFYFITRLFVLLMKVVHLFVALFQFLGSLVAGLFRTIFSWLSFSPDTTGVSFPSVSQSGMSTVTFLAEKIGLLSVVPLLCLAMVWFFFVLRVLDLFGVKIGIRTGGSDD